MEKTPKAFQRRLILYNLLIVICIAGAISFYNYTTYRQDVIASETQSSKNRILSLSDRMEVAYNEMTNILLNCTERSTMFVSSAFTDTKRGYENPREAVYAADALKNLCAISGYSKDIYKISLYSHGFLLQAGSSIGYHDDPVRIMEAEWFEPLLKRSANEYALTLVDNPFSLGHSTTPKLLPLLRPINQWRNQTPEDSWVFLGISPTLFQDALDIMPPQTIIFAATSEGDIIASRGNEDPDGSPLYDGQALAKQLLDRKEMNGSFQADLPPGNCVISYVHQSVSGLLFFEVLPTSSIQFDKQVIFNTIGMIFLFCFVIGLTLSYLFSRQLGAPIRRLNERLSMISQGDFRPDPSIETDDEIGTIGKQINHMSSHISTLLDTRVHDEKEKKDMEIKMLQAQINPHFLYNTLDSIKWIATMQKNTGIVQVVTALSSLLKNMAKGFNEKVTFRQELDFLQNYVTIEKIRYIELFDVEISVDDDALYDARIIKLTLQPIVENAIFSGIEPSGRFGLISIHAFAKDGVFYVTVRDNGIGIEPENIEKLLTDTSRITKSNMSGIGLPNVDRRLKLVYGEDYGITIESEIDRYTMITISLPLEY